MIDQLVKIYLEHENWYEKPKLSREDAIFYYATVLKKGRITCIATPEGQVAGYIESWRITYEQMARIICGEQFSPLDQDVQNGNICWVAGITLIPEYRKTEAIRLLKLELFKNNYMCDYFAGEARRKKHQPVKVFKRQEFYEKYSGGVLNGKCK